MLCEVNCADIVYNLVIFTTDNFDNGNDLH